MRDLRVYNRPCLSLCANDSRKQSDKSAPDRGQHYLQRDVVVV